MTYAEALDWMAYIRKRGSLNPGLRIDAAVAVLATQINRALGGKAEMQDFLPYHDEPEAASIDDIAKIFGAVRVR